MIGVPMNPNSVHVSMIQSKLFFFSKVDKISILVVFTAGCCKGEFDSTYPIHLNGIISQGEYQQSIEKINRTIASNGGLMMTVILFIVLIVVSMTFFIAGGLTGVNSRTIGFPPLIGVGMGLAFVGSFVFIIAIIFVNIRRTARIRQAIAEESAKYSSRSPTPCSWRLETARYFTGTYGNNNSYTTFYVRRIIIPK